jgi:hypothetical protein
MLKLIDGSSRELTDPAHIPTRSERGRKRAASLADVRQSENPDRQAEAARQFLAESLAPSLHFVKTFLLFSKFAGRDGFVPDSVVSQLSTLMCS